jgi:hypothetical protein
MRLEYLIEAYRVLRFGDLLKIAKPNGRFAHSTNALIQNIRASGFKILGEISRSDHLIYI